MELSRFPGKWVLVYCDYVHFIAHCSLQRWSLWSRNVTVMNLFLTIFCICLSSSLEVWACSWHNRRLRNFNHKRLLDNSRSKVFFAKWKLQHSPNWLKKLRRLDLLDMHRMKLLPSLPIHYVIINMRSNGKLLSWTSHSTVCWARFQLIL